MELQVLPPDELHLVCPVELNEEYAKNQRGQMIQFMQELLKRPVRVTTSYKPNPELLAKQPKALSKQEVIINKYGSMDAYYDAAPIVCKVAKEKSLFITAEGLALPCCWTAGRMYKWWHKDPKIEQIWDFIPNKRKLDARLGLRKVFETGVFDDIQSSWNKSSCSDGKLKVCAMKCGAEFDPFAEQFK